MTERTTISNSRPPSIFELADQPEEPSAANLRPVSIFDLAGQEQPETPSVQPVSIFELAGREDVAGSPSLLAQPGGVLPPRPVRLIPTGLREIPGFGSRERTDSVAENIKLDFEDLLDGYKALGRFIAKEGFSAIPEIASRFGPAVVESYTRWVEAARQGKFVDAIRAHPVEFIQDLTLPLSFFFGGVGGIVGLFGKTSTVASKVARISSKVARLSDVAGVVSDPIGGLGVAGARRAGGAAFRAVVPVKTPPPRAQRMNIAADPDIPKGPLAERVPRMLQKIETSVANSNVPLIRLGKEAGDAGNLSDLVQTFGGVERKIRLALEKGLFDPEDFTQVTGNPGLKQILEDLGSEQINDFKDYMVARRALLDLEPRKIAHGQNLNEARKVIEEFSQRPDLEKARLDMKKFSDDVLTYYQKGGVISKNLADSFRKQNPNYIPFLRAGVDASSRPLGGQSLRQARQVVKRIKGSERALRDPVEATYIMTARMMREVELNQIGKAIAEIADLPEGAQLVKKIKPPQQKIFVTKEELARTLDLEGLAESAGVRQEALFTSNSPIYRPSEKLPDNVITVFEDGRRAFYEVDPDIAQAYASLRFNPKSDVGTWLGDTLQTFMRSFAGLQRAGVTLAPGFSLGLNIFRDTVQATTYSKYGFAPLFSNYQGFKSFFKKDEFFDLWAKSGGMQANLSAIDRPALTRSLQKWLAPQNRSYLQSISDEIKQPIEILRLLQETSEAGTRIGVFKRGLRTELKMLPGETLEAAIERNRAAGADVNGLIRKAAVESREATVDFAVQGADPMLRWWNSITAFENANIQGINLARRRFFTGTAKERAKITARSMLWITVPSLAMHVRNMNDPEYRRIPQVEKDLFWHQRIGDTLYRIPKPFEVGMIFGSFFERAIDAAVEDDPTELTRFGSLLADQFQPFAAPTVVKPILEVFTGRNFFFNSQLEPRSVKGLVKSERALPNTSELGRVVSKFTEWLAEAAPSTTAGKPAEAFLSPIEVDQLIFGTTGTLGRGLVQAADPLLGGLRTDVARPDPKGGFKTRVPIINRFISNPSKRDQTTDDFFEVGAALQRKLTTLKSLRFQGDRTKFLQENRKDIADAAAFQQAMRLVQQINQARTIITNSKSLRGKEKRKRLDDLDDAINRVAKQAMANRKRKRK